MAREKREFRTLSNLQEEIETPRKMTPSEAGRLGGKNSALKRQRGRKPGGEIMEKPCDGVPPVNENPPFV